MGFNQKPLPQFIGCQQFGKDGPVTTRPGSPQAVPTDGGAYGYRLYA
jgi:hypothetical protein